MEDQSQHYTNYGLVVFPLYVIFIVTITTLISINQKRFKNFFKIDSLIVFMLIYTGNFVFCTLQFRSINMYVRIGIPTILMYLIVYLCGKFQIIGLTGGISCGKSVLSKYFEERLKVKIIDCDVLSRRVVEVGKPAYTKIVQYFGDRILEQDRTINRKLLGEIIFNDKQKRAFLTKTTGYYIIIEIIKEVYRICFKGKEQLVLLDAPLLFESKILQYFCYPIIVVYISDEALQVQRLINRDNITKEEALQRINSQMPIKNKIAKADLLLCNDGSQEELKMNLGKQLFSYMRDFQISIIIE